MKWIPGNKPEEEGKHWVTCRYEYGYYSIMAWCDVWDDGFRWMDGECMSLEDEVVAYMPYLAPEPYNPGKC